MPLNRRDMLKIRWEFFLVRLRLKKHKAVADAITKHFLRKGWSLLGTVDAATPEEMLKELKNYYKIRRE